MVTQTPQKRRESEPEPDDALEPRFEPRLEPKATGDTLEKPRL